MATKTWYVASDGNDGAGGSLAAPFRTINKAASVANPGETVAVRGGIYREEVHVTRASITITNYNGELVAVDGTGLSPSEGLFNLMPGSHHVTIAGLVIQNSSKYGLENSGH